jgi:hypothetical protein
MVRPAKDLDGLLLNTGLTEADEHDHRSGWDPISPSRDCVIP